MVKQTPNHGLNKWEQGDTNWSHSTDMQTVEERLVIRDAESALGNYTPHAGSTFVATDTGAVYDGDGSSWNLANRKNDSLNVNELSIGEDGPATSFSQIAGSGTGNVPTQDVGTDTQYDAILYRTGWKTGDYKGIVFRDATTFTDSSDAGTVLESVSDHLVNNFDNGAKGGAGQIAIPRNQYFFETTANITADGTKLVGGGEYQQGRRYTGPVFAPDGLSDQQPMVHFNEAEGSAAYGLTFAHSGTGCYGLQISNADNCMLYGLENYGDMTSIARSVYVNGSYNSNMDNCYLYQVEMNEDTSLPKNINQWRIYRCDFRTANADTPVLQLADGGNYMMYSIINSDLEDGDMNDGVPAVTGSRDQSFQRWHFHSCLNIGNGGDPVYDHTGSCSWVNCFMGGGNGPLFENIAGCIVTGCRIAGKNEVLVATDDGAINQARFTDNRVTSTMNISGVAALDLRGTGERSKDFVIARNQFYGNNGTYDIRLGSKNAFAEGEITDNYLADGLSGEDWGGAVQGPKAPKITGNMGYNPVRNTRTPPSIPTSTSTSPQASNFYAQPVEIYLEGGKTPYDPRIWDHTGTAIDIGGSPNRIKLDRFGQIGFRSNVPNSWTWYWE